MRGVRVRVWSMAIVGLIGVSACGGGSGGSDAAADQGSETTSDASGTSPASVATTAATADPDAGAKIMNYTFTVTGAVAAGTPLTITNKDTVNHTFTNPDGAFGVEVPAGGTAQITVATPGTYKVVCTIHSSMGTQIVVV